MPVGDDRLAPDELAALGTLAEAVDLNRVRLHRGAGGAAARLLRSALLTLSGGRAVTLGNHVFLPDGCCRSVPVLAHELTHCAQYQAWGPRRYFARGLADRIRELRHRLGLGASPYDYAADAGRPFETYGMEQQGQIVEDCFRGKSAALALSPYRPPEADTACRMAAANASTSASEVSKAVIQRTSDRSSSHT
ncbi:MAG TPA: DUF4157 domain-containing protein [Gemmatimonadales bacterium]|nr:DUF4157 domain-containing protein [Gemmatimonadales bacterium]